MSVAVGIFLAAIGAVLKFAVADQVDGVDLSTIGVILMIAGALIAIISLLYDMSRRDRVVEDRVVETPVQREEIRRRP